MTGGAAAAYTVECTNERPVNGTAILAALTLDATHRNRFTPIAPTTATTVTLLPYAGIVTGSEHEFFHNGAGYVVTFVEGPGTTIRSVANRRTLTSYGAATAKYVGGGVFALIGALEL